MYKWLTLFLLTAASVVCANHIGDIDGLDKPFASGDLIGYDLHIDFDLSKYVEGFGLGNQTENNKTYYQEFIATPTKTGSYLFDNYASSLIGLEGPTTDTQLLIYNEAPQQIIITAPWGFNNGTDTGFVGGVPVIDATTGEGNISDPGTPSFVGQPGAFYGSFDLEKDVDYTIVFTSFDYEAFGSMDVNITGPGYIAPIPEPKAYILILGWCLFLYVAFRRRTY
tara:strand:- start:2231 stop:2902 length:672 start_codon:yes stop_codon:yes gene_type:complete